MSGLIAIEWFLNGELETSDIIGNEWEWLEDARAGIKLQRPLPAGTVIECKVSFTPRMAPVETEC